MASSQRYTREELLQLRNSPLVRKPESLPSIEQWMEVPRFRDDPIVQRKRSQARDDAESALRFAGPITLNRRNKSQAGDDIVLGPPNTNFASKRPQPPAKPAERPLGLMADDDAPKDADPQDGPRSRKTEGLRDKSTSLSGRRTRDGDDDAWTARKAYQADDFGKWDDRERRPRVGDPRSVPLKRSGVGRGYFGASWIRPDDGGDDSKKEPSGRGRNVPWRDGVRDRTKDWNRPSRTDAIEDDPEWMDDAEEAPDDKQPTQEDFEKWKKEMKAKKAPAKDKEESSSSSHSPRTPTGSQPTGDIANDPSVKTEARSLAGFPPSRMTPASGVLPTLGSMFGTFEDAAKEDKLESPQRPQPKAKSRFEGLFKKDEPPVPAPPPAELRARPTSSGLQGGEQPDHKDFNRILAMLGSKPPMPNDPNDARPEQPFDTPRRQEERAPANPEQEFLMYQEAYARDVAESHARINERIHNEQRQQHLEALGHPNRFDMQAMRNGLQNQPMPGSAFPQMHNAAAPHRNVHRDNEFLLHLMHRQREGARPNDIDVNQFRHMPKGMDSLPPHMPGPRQTGPPHAPPPGLMEAHRRLNEQEIAVRRAQVPPHFFEHPDAMANMAMAPPPGLTRRNTADNARLPPMRNAPASNLGIPSLQLDELHHLRGGAAHMGVDGRLVAAPPPGLIPGGGPGSVQQPPAHGNGPMMPPLHGLNGPFGGPFGGPLHGPFPGQVNGPLGGPVHGPPSGPLNGPNGPLNGPNGPLNGPLNGHPNGPPNGPLNGPLDGPLPNDKAAGVHRADGPPQLTQMHSGPSMGQQQPQLDQKPEQQDQQAQHQDQQTEQQHQQQPSSPQHQQLHQQDPKMQLQQPPPQQLPPGFPHGMPPPRGMHGMPVGGPPGPPGPGPHGLFGPPPPHMGHPFFGGGPPAGPSPQGPLPPPPPGSAAFFAAAGRGFPQPYPLPPDMRDAAARGGYPGM